MHGSSVMSQADLPDAYELSIRLCAPDLPRYDKLDLTQRLNRLVTLEQSVPCGVGSGKSGLRYKMHAALHSTRLVSPSWSAVGTAWNNTVTIVGDMGERTLPTYHGDMRKLVGAWIEDGDGDNGQDFDFDAAFDQGCLARKKGTKPLAHNF